MQRIDLNSTSLKAAVYRDRLAVLELEFRAGEVYRYFGVPEQTYRDLLRAESKGGYFNRHIRNRFEHAKVHPPGLAIPDSGAARMTEHD